MPRDRSLLVITAIGHEYRILQKLISFESQIADSNRLRHTCGTIHRVKIDLIQVGVGCLRASENLKSFFHLPNHWGILMLGYCGSLSKRFQVGDMVFGRKVVRRADSLQFQCSPGPDQSATRLLNIEEGHFLCSDQMILSVREKIELGARFGCDVVDMESFALYELSSSIPTWVAKAVSDDLTEDFPGTEKDWQPNRVKETLKAYPDFNLRFQNNLVQAQKSLEKSIPLMIQLLSRKVFEGESA